MGNRIEYSTYVFEDDHIDSANLFLAASLLSSQLQVNSFRATVRCADPSILDFQRNSKLTFFSGGRQRGIFCVQSIERVAPELYDISATSVLGLLTEGQHMGGIYTGQTAEEVIGDICGTVPYIVKTVLAGVKLYGWLPIATPRDNLSQVLFAIGAALRTDLDGVLRIAGLWDGISGQAPEDRMYEDATVDYSARITQVIVTEHQYIAGSEEKQLFEGTSQAGDVITFDEPMHSLMATGFAIQASGANWARVSAGTGTLSGKTYIHNTRQVTRNVNEAATPNVKQVEKATLVSLVNSNAVAQRLADYYKCRERVDAQVVYGGELPGDRLATYHPFDKVGVAACMESADITMSNTLAAKEKLLVGYVPEQFTDISYLDFREVLTGSGQWDPPEGVEEVTYVLFSGAQGGGPGSQGETSSGSTSKTYTVRGNVTQTVKYTLSLSLWGGEGGKGGAGGPGGKGSKVLQGTMSVSHGTPVHFSCGVGGTGALFGQPQGAEGGDTTFGGVNTADGSYPGPAGWQDPITQEIFAATGPSGLPGGDGAGAKPGYTLPTNYSNMNDILVYQPSTGAYDEDGNYWPGATTRESSAGVAWHTNNWGTLIIENVAMGGAQAGYALGPGGVAGVTQEEPSARGTVSVNSRAIRGTATGGIAPPAPVKPRKRGLTEGGRGGYGGGGGSAPSWVGVETTPDFTGSYGTNPGTAGTGGPGGPGSDGGDGMIILFYSKPKKIEDGQFVDKNGKAFLDMLQRRFIV